MVCDVRQPTFEAAHANGATVGVYLFAQGDLLEEGALDANVRNAQLATQTLELEAGEHIRFAVTDGGDGYNGDATMLSATLVCRW